jgi:hypothetical protein
MLRVVVVGGGPAGFMAAIAAAGAGTQAAVSIYDAGTPLATLRRTAGGTCNLTNAGSGPSELSAQYPRGGKFLVPAFTRFGPVETMAWFRRRGLPLVVKDGGRVFPRSGRATDVRAVLEGEARRLGVRIRARHAVTGISRGDASFTVTTSRGEMEADRIIIATGGGCAEGYEMARSLGHAVTPLASSLTDLVTEETWPLRLAGIAVPAARMVGMFAGRRVAEETGSLLFTSEGLSGPLAFHVSARSAFLPVSASRPLLLQLSVHPRTGSQDYEQALMAACSERPRQLVATTLRAFLPRAVADVVLELTGVDPSLSGCELTREKRRALARCADRIPLTVVERKNGEEAVTAGGVALDDVDQKTMESRVVAGLHFCGEVLDIDGFTGGFNLQAAWSTGMLAGLAAGG